MPIGASDYPYTILPDSHWRALYAAAEVLVDLLYQDLVALELGTAPPELASAIYLPPAWRPRYSVPFLRRFVVASIAVGLKLRHPRFCALECVAEELALHAMLEYAAVVLEEAGETADFGDWTDLALEDTDIELLYEPRFDGLEGTAVGRDLGLANLRFDEWFTPFRQPHTLHPYVAPVDEDLWERDHTLYPPDTLDA